MIIPLLKDLGEIGSYLYNKKTFKYFLVFIYICYKLLVRLNESFLLIEN